MVPFLLGAEYVDQAADEVTGSDEGLDETFSRPRYPDGEKVEVTRWGLIMLSYSPTPTC